MARKRMFSLDVIDSDRFLDMPCSAQALYFHLGMNGDDDGFVSSPRKIMNTIGGKSDDLKLLASKGFIIPFESGVCVITDWKINNTLKNDRYKPTLFLEEKAQLTETKAGRFHLGTNLEPQHSIAEQNIAKQSEAEQSIGEYASLSGESAETLMQEFFDVYRSRKGKTHPKLSDATYAKCYAKLREIASVVALKEFRAMANNFFDELPDSTHHISHFLCDGVLNVRMCREYGVNWR